MRNRMRSYLPRTHLTRSTALTAGVIPVLLLAGLHACTSQDGDPGALSSSAPSGAAFTTFDQTLQGCEDSPNGINCNHYTCKERVYMSGGPAVAGLEDGTYFFAVLTPGSQNGGFIDGAAGNLSEDPVSNR